MAHFPRSMSSSADGDPDRNDRPPARPDSAAEILRRQREALGLELDDVAAALRIKPAYIAVLEAASLEQLPGPVYATGFLRAYADHLGLDANEMVRRFKAEATGFAANPDLGFPISLGERSIPGSGTLLAAALLAICGYGFWYYLSTDDSGDVERVAEVPPALLMPRPPLPPTPPNEAPPVSTDAAGSSGPGSVAPRLAAASAAPPPEFSKGIVIRATARCWVEIRDPKNSVLLARVLKAGETYRLPDQPGFSMRAGNAGGLEITVDGRPVPPIGRTGKVRCHVALDPQALMAGSAVRN
jgi:cytoskeleton protein RodZ